MEALAAVGDFHPPSLATLESSLEYGLAQRAGRVFADLWDIEKLIQCPECSGRRVDRLRLMNATQRIAEPIACADCSNRT